ncbi:hypothetical protein T08_2991, partial [Trichinella sp. T8]
LSRLAACRVVGPHTIHPKMVSIATGSLELPLLTH